MRARCVFAEMSGVNSKKNAVGAIWAQLYAILDDGSQNVRDLSFCVFSHRQFKNGGTAMKMFLAMSLMLFAGMESSAWETRPGWPALPSQNNGRIQVALARGTASDPSATFPLTEPGKPVSCWWNDDALYIGTNIFPFVSLGVTPKDGVAFSVNVPVVEGWSFASGMREIVLDVVLDESAATFKVPDFGILGNQTVDLTVTVSPKKSGNVRVFSNAVGARSPRFIRDKILKAEAGETVEAHINGPAPDSGNHIFDIYDTDGKVIFMAFWPFHDPEVKFAYRTVTSDPAKMLLLLDVDQWIGERDDLDLTIAMDDLETGVFTGFSLTKRLEKKSGRLIVPFDVSELRSGTFKMRYEVTDAARGMVVCSDYAYYAKPDGACVWDGTTYGSEDTVPAPWTQPEFDTDGFKVWNRNVKLGGAGLVSSIVSDGQELLSAPVEILLDGCALQFYPAGVERHVSFADYRLCAKGASVSAKIRAEFDGYMWIELGYAPPVKSLGVRVPMRRDRVIGFDDCVDPAKKLALPPGTIESMSYSPQERPWWWMGSSVGLMGGVDNLHGWHCRNLRSGVLVTADNSEATVTYTIVDEPLNSGEMRTVGFYLQPTPVKPKNMELALMPRSKLVTWTGTMARFFDVKLPGWINMDKLAKFQAEQRKGKRVFYYNGTSVNSPVQPWWGWLGQEWNECGDPAFFAEEVRFTDRAHRDSGVWVTGCLNSKSFFDHKLWSICWFLNHPDFGVKDMYFDIARPLRECRNTLHGCIWKDDFGRTMHASSFRTCREIHKRIYRELKKKNPDGAMLGHLGSTRTPSDVFFDRLWMGEAYDRFVRGTMSYYDVLNPEMMQIQYASRSAEVVVDMLPQIDRAMSMVAPEKIKTYDPHTPENDRVNRHATAYFKIHDLEITPQGRGADQWSKPDDVLRAFGIRRRHRAYYHADCPVSVAEPEPRFIYAQFAGNGRRLVILLNDTDEEKSKTVSVQGESSVGRDIFNSRAYDFTSGRCRVTLPPRESAFILFNEEKK